MDATESTKRPAPFTARTTRVIVGLALDLLCLAVLTSSTRAEPLRANWGSGFEWDPDLREPLMYLLYAIAVVCLAMLGVEIVERRKRAEPQGGVVSAFVTGLAALFVVLSMWTNEETMFTNEGSSSGVWPVGPLIANLEEFFRDDPPAGPVASPSTPVAEPAAGAPVPAWVHGLERAHRRYRGSPLRVYRSAAAVGVVLHEGIAGIDDPHAPRLASAGCDLAGAPATAADPAVVVAFCPRSAEAVIMGAIDDPGRYISVVYIPFVALVLTPPNESRRRAFEIAEAIAEGARTSVRDH